MAIADWYQNGKQQTRDDVRASVDSFLAWSKKPADDAQREAIVDYIDAHDVVVMHAASRVLGGCCHCAKCLRGERTQAG
ncbi:MAG TPA: hypothetical protein VLT45_08565 [Kofleriaceae bacterium]|nr:hypothetical protein [Kofleriaceae bacterium]